MPDEAKPVLKVLEGKNIAGLFAMRDFLFVDVASNREGINLASSISSKTDYRPICMAVIGKPYVAIHPDKIDLVEGLYELQLSAPSAPMHDPLLDYLDLDAIKANRPSPPAADPDTLDM